MDSEEALEELRRGNERFVAGVRDGGAETGAARRQAVLGGQKPRAVVLGCADSRVPVGTVFDQGIGDLFVIRVAGNIAGISQIGSVEYAVQHLGVPLVVVLGHTHCGAVQATMDGLDQQPAGVSPHIRAIVREIRPAIEGLPPESELSGDERVSAAVRANVHGTVARLREASSVLAEGEGAGEVKILGAVYALETGLVEFLAPSL